MKRKSLKYYKKHFDFSTEDYDSLTVSQLKQQADYWLRQYLLSSADTKNGRYWCPLKQSWFSKDDIQVAHYIDRNVISLRYDLENCHLVSKQSNSFDAQISYQGYKSKHHFEYEQWLGREIVEKLVAMSKNLTIFARQDYIEKIKFFRNGTTSLV